MAASRYSRALQAIPFLIAVCFVSFPAQAQYSGGTGDPNDPYQIATAEDLMLLGETPEDYDKHFIMTADIDLDPNLPGRKVFDRAVIAPDADDATWQFEGTSFTGIFDGNGHTISHLAIEGVSHLGLFGKLDYEASISNLGMEVVDINGVGEYVGGLVGRNGGYGGSLREGIKSTVSNSYSTGRVTGVDNVGGLVGSIGTGASVSNSYSICSIRGIHNVGGLAGEQSEGRITASCSTGIVEGKIDVGGLVGYRNAGELNNSYSSGAVTGEENVGGLVGRAYNGANISDSYSTGSVTGNEQVGGLVGRNNTSHIITSYSTGTVSGIDYVGGLVGLNAHYNIIQSSYSISMVYGKNSVGGLVGSCISSSISNSYSSGAVTGELRVGGLVGGIGRSTVINSYSTGVVSGNQDVGGFVGWNASFPINSCFWDIETSGRTTSAGGTGKTTAEMQTASTFLEAGWDFVNEIENGTEDIWKIIEGQTYPLLSWQKYGGGTGEPDNPYLIFTAERLNALGAEPNDYDKHFKLMADIDLSGYSYDKAVIAPDVNDAEGGLQGIPFTGVFDGNNHVISHLTIQGGSGLGLFGTIGSEATVTNLGLEAVDVNGTGAMHIGGLVGVNWGSITTSFSTGAINGNWHVGGLVGLNGGSITASHSTAMVRGESLVGGLAGINMYGNVIKCCAAGTVTYTNPSLVFPEGKFGGLVGVNRGGSITASCSIGTVTGRSDAGGLVGSNGGSISNCYSSAPVNSTHWSVGGLVGRNSDCFRWFSGTRCLNGNITSSYSTGTVSGGGNAGGLVGYNDEGITSSFWDIETSGQAESDGGTGLTAAEMQTASTFLEAGWDFINETTNGTEDIWWILEGQGYPRLSWELPIEYTVLVVDDFESYNDLGEDDPASNRIYLTWLDFWTGAMAGNLDTPLMSSGRSSAQAMPVSYDFTYAGRTPELCMTLVSGKDWTEQGATRLVLWFKGDPGNSPERMYVALGNAIVYHPDDAATQDGGWNEWVIDLQEFANQGVDLTNVASIRLGFGTRNAPVATGGYGKVHFDDITLVKLVQ